MYYIKRNGEFVEVLKIKELAGWNREYEVVPLSFHTLKKAEEIAKVWSDAEIVFEDGLQIAA